MDVFIYRLDIPRRDTGRIETRLEAAARHPSFARWCCADFHAARPACHTLSVSTLVG